MTSQLTLTISSPAQQLQAAARLTPQLAGEYLAAYVRRRGCLLLAECDPEEMVRRARTLRAMSDHSRALHMAFEIEGEEQFPITRDFGANATALSKNGEEMTQSERMVLEFEHHARELEREKER
jgi:hypothetical protein